MPRKIVLHKLWCVITGSVAWSVLVLALFLNTDLIESLDGRWELSASENLSVGTITADYNQGTTTNTTASVFSEHISALLPRTVQARLQYNVVAGQCLFDSFSQRYSLRKAQRFAAWRCSGGCGGVGDRTRGLISVFLHALAIGYGFVIEWNSPSPLYPEILVPGEAVKWAARQHSNVPSMHLSFMDNNRPYGLCSWLRHKSVVVKTNSLIPTDSQDCENHLPYVRDILANQSVVRECRANSIWRLECMGCVWWYLFRPGVRLETALEAELRNLEAWKRANNMTRATAVGVHLRMGDSTMSAQKGREAKEDVLLPMMEKCVSRITSQIPQSFLVVVSDSKHACEGLRARMGVSVYTTRTQPSHVDRTRFAGDQGRDGTVNAFVDLMMLAVQDVLVLSGSSGYGLLAQGLGMYAPGQVVQCFY